MKQQASHKGFLKKCSLLCLLLISDLPSRAQGSLSLKFFGLSFHPKKQENAALMPRRFDDKGLLVLNIGGMASYEHFVYKDLFTLKTIQALYSDCAARLGGFSHVGFRARLLKSGRHALYTGMGPTLIFRRNWSQLPGYRKTSVFKGAETDKFQHLFLWYGGEFEYTYKLSKHLDLSVIFIPGYPDLLGLSFGISFRTGKK